VAWTAAGLQLPRDANQQSLVGMLVATPWYRDALLPGDILFFVDRAGRTIHTGISLGGDLFIHASPPEVHITSLDPGSEHYSATWDHAFLFARRPME
jgi:cell wall-associated NlpC family hydrolase